MERLVPTEELLVRGSDKLLDTTASEIFDLLSRHSDLITPHVRQTIIQKEITRALEKYKEKRKEGLANDDSSLNPGLRIFLLRPAYEETMRICREAGYRIPDQQIDEINQNLFKLIFPNGVYRASLGINFYQEAASDWTKSKEASKPFALHYNQVIRVEGQSGELWQNKDYTWDGKLK